MDDLKNNIKVNEVLESFYKLFYKTENLALKNGIKELTHTELHIIDAIGRDSLTMHELSERVGVTMGTATVAVTKLVGKKFVKRSKSDEDRRKTFVSLDVLGLSALSYHENYHEMLLTSITAGIPSEDLVKFIDTFEIILKNLNRKTACYLPLE